MISPSISAKKVSVSQNSNRKRFRSRKRCTVNLISLSAYRLRRTLGTRNGRKKLKFGCAENMVDEYGRTSIELPGLKRDAPAFKLKRLLMAMVLPTLIKRGWRGGGGGYPTGDGRWKVVFASPTVHPLSELSLATNSTITQIPT